MYLSRSVTYVYKPYRQALFCVLFWASKRVRRPAGRDPPILVCCILFADDLSGTAAGGGLESCFGKSGTTINIITKQNRATDWPSVALGSTLNISGSHLVAGLAIFGNPEC
jgi:hypothetical protein